MTWLPIQYRDFYDVPRAFLVRDADAVYFFDCPFDDSADAYPDRYCVYRLDPAAAVPSGAWAGSAATGVATGDVLVKDVHFDPTRRAAVDAAVLERL